MTAVLSERGQRPCRSGLLPRPRSLNTHLWRERFGWWLMGWPLGVRTIGPFGRWSIRYGPYRWGAWLARSREQ